MGKLQLLDTGYVANKAILTQVGQQLSVSERAGFDGSLNVNGFVLDTFGSNTYGGASNVDQKNSLDFLDDATTSVISVANDTIKISAYFFREISDTLYQHGIMYQLNRLKKTRGLKLLYPSAADVDGKKTIVEAMGQKNIGGNFSEALPTDTKGTVSETTPYLVGRVTNVTIADPTNGTRWGVSFDFVIEGEEQ